MVGAISSAQSGLLTSVTPTGASTLATINIVGTGFDPTASKNEVSFIPASGPALTAVPSAIATVDATAGSRRLTVKVPAGLPVGVTALRVRNVTTGSFSDGKSLDVIAISLPGIASLPAGAVNQDVRITGSANTHFVAGNTQVTFGTGVTVNKVTVQSDTTLLANISIPATTAASVRTVQVTSAQIAILPGAFTITSGGGSTNHNPTASAGGPYSGFTAAAISFGGSGSDPDAGDTLSFAWNFGDGGTGVGASPTHSYATAGPFTATLTVSDGHGGSATATAAVTITAPPPPNHNPTASAGGPYSGQTGAAISFSGSGSDPDAGDTLSFAWNFGDGATGVGATPTHAYSTAGPFTATLTVSDGHGGSATATASVTVTAPPPPNHNPTASAGGPYSGLTSTAISFSGSGSDPDAGDTLSFAWNFGDGATGVGTSPTHAYSTAGPFTATLTVTDGHGGSATATASVTSHRTASTESQPDGISGRSVFRVDWCRDFLQRQRLRSRCWRHAVVSRGTSAMVQREWALRRRTCTRLLVRLPRR